MAATCPKCKGEGRVKVWESIDPVSKVATGWFKMVRKEDGTMEYVKKPCPHCGEARRYLAERGGE